MAEQNQRDGLDQFYRLRRDFIIIGLTGKMQAGADKFVEILRKESIEKKELESLKKFEENYKNISKSETLKIRRIREFFEFKDNWRKFSVIEYKNVILLFILNHCYNKNHLEFSRKIVEWIIELGEYKDFKTPRFGGKVGIAKGSKEFLKTDFLDFLQNSFKNLESIEFFNREYPLEEKILEYEKDFFFSKEYDDFAKDFFDQLDSYSVYLRHKLVHVASYCLRRFGTLDVEEIKKDQDDDNLKHIYIIADVINDIIKKHRKSNQNKVHIIIDRLKNSYEMMYFREKYGGFYTVVNNRKESEREKGIKEKLKQKADEFGKDIKEYEEDNFNLLSNLDETEYKVEEFKKGMFDGFDIENCVQKADYHLWRDDELYSNWCKEGFNFEKEIKALDKNYEKTNAYYVYQPYLVQVLKFIALIQQPGLIVPTYPERIMQIAYNAKLNSGCISRQVGAVVTDEFFSVKGIGWNEVPQGQTPCSLRDLRDLIHNENLEVFTHFEKNGNKNSYKDNITFKEKIEKDYEKVNDVEKKLKGRPCSFCFKTFHNAYEGEKNQVHTRSLHAEENAMFQIAKYGGQPLIGGNLFTTASPCELCSKKAYQLGIKNIFYIDVYPGISEKQILKGGKDKANPKLFRYQGVIGKGYQKLYEPFMSIKDETTLITEIKPTQTEETKIEQLKKVLDYNFTKKGKEKVRELIKPYLNKKNGI